MQNGRHNFLQGAMILSGAIVIVKILGAIYKIPLTNMIGEMGMSAFNTAYQLYMPIYTIASAGLPAAVARFVSAQCAAGNMRSARMIFRKCMPMLLLSGGVGMILMELGAGFYANAVGNPAAVWSVRMLAPTVFFCCIVSGLRGYYAGLQNMTPTALSQILEAVGRLVLGLSGARAMLIYCRTEYRQSGTVLGQSFADETAALGFSSALASAAAIFGVTAGSLFGLIALLLYDRCHRPLRLSRTEIRADPLKMGPILRSAMPICAGALMINLCSVLDTMLLQTRIRMISPDILRGRFLGLESVADADIPSFLYGSFGMAQNLAAFVPTMAQAIGTSALSSVAYAAAHCMQALRDAVEDVLRLTALIAFPAGFGLSAIAGPVLLLLYGVRPNGAQIAAPSLIMLGFASVFMTLSVPVNSMLQAVGRADIPVKLLILGFAVKWTANMCFISIPSLNLVGACMGTLLCYALVSCVGLIALARCCKRIRIGRCLLRPLLAGALCAAAAYAVSTGLAAYSPEIRVSAAIAAAFVVYAAALLFSRVLCRRDLEMLPGGKKMADGLAKHGWIR